MHMTSIDLEKALIIYQEINLRINWQQFLFKNCWNEFLPSYRFSGTRTFLIVDIDGGRPIESSESRCRIAITSKAYIALFVCMVPRVIHLVDHIFVERLPLWQQIYLFLVIDVLKWFTMSKEAVLIQTKNIFLTFQRLIKKIFKKKLNVREFGGKLFFRVNPITVIYKKWKKLNKVPS